MLEPRRTGPSGLAVAAALAAAGALAAAAASAEQAAGADELLAAARAAYAKRHDPAESARAVDLFEKAIEAGAGYPAMWEGSRAAGDRGASRMPGAKRREQRALYKMGIDWARLAVKARPGGPEGHLYLAINLGHHAKSQSFLHQMGVAGELRREAETAVKLGPTVECGVPLRLLGLYYLRLPEAFGGDDRRALELLARAVVVCPHEPAPRLHHAEALEANGQREKAIAELEWVLANPPRSKADRADYRGTAAEARKLLQKLQRGSP